MAPLTHDQLMSAPNREIPNIICDASVNVVDRFPVDEIIRRYKAELDINVSSNFSGLRELLMVECEATHLRYYWPQTCLGDGGLYDLLQKRPGYYSEGKWEHLEALKWVKSGQRVLEIGAGDGTFLHMLMQSKSLSVTPVGLEMSVAAIRSAAGRGISLSADSLAQHAEKHPLGYDVVCAFQVLEHVSDPRGFIRDCVSCLRPGGQLILATPCCDPYIYQYDRWHTLNLPPHHASLWSPSAYRRVAELFGLSVQEIKHQALGADLWHFTRVWAQHYAGSYFGRLAGLIVSACPRIVTRWIGKLLPGHSILVKMVKPSDFNVG